MQKIYERQRRIKNGWSFNSALPFIYFLTLVQRFRFLIRHTVYQRSYEIHEWFTSFLTFVFQVKTILAVL